MRYVKRHIPSQYEVKFKHTGEDVDPLDEPLNLVFYCGKRAFGCDIR